MTLESSDSWYERNNMDEAQKGRAAFMKLGGLYSSEKITNEKKVIDNHITAINNAIPGFEDEFFRFFGQLEGANSGNVDVTKLKEFLYSLVYACRASKPKYQNWWRDGERENFKGMVREWFSGVDKLKISTAFLFWSNQYGLSYTGGKDINSWRSIEESLLNAVRVPAGLSMIPLGDSTIPGSALGSLQQKNAIKVQKLIRDAKSGMVQAASLLSQYVDDGGEKPIDSKWMRQVDKMYDDEEVEIVLSAKDKQKQIEEKNHRLELQKKGYNIFTVGDIVQTIGFKEIVGSEDSQILKNMKQELENIRGKYERGEIDYDLFSAYNRTVLSYTCFDLIDAGNLVDVDGLKSGLKEKYGLFSEELRSSIVEYVDIYFEKFNRVKEAFGKFQGTNVLGLPLSEFLYYNWRSSIEGSSKILYKSKLDEILAIPDATIVNNYYEAYIGDLRDKNMLTEENIKEIAGEQYSERIRFKKEGSKESNPLIDYSRVTVIKGVLKKYKNSPTAENLRLIEYFAKRAFPSIASTVDGKWDDVIANYLQCLSSDRGFLDDKEYTLIINDILSQHGRPNADLSDKYKTLSSIENEIENAYQASAEMLDELGLWNFDTSSPYSIYKVKPQYRKGVVEKYIPQTKEDSDKFNFILHNSKNGKLDKSIISLTDDEIERIIPRKPYLDAVTKFITENDAEAFKKDPLLAEKIMDGFHFDDPDLENLKDNWYEGGNQGIINEYRNNVGGLIKFQSGETALGVREGLFEGYMKEKCGFSIEYLPSNDPEIFRFQDKNNQGIVYRFKPLTGEIFVEREGVLDIGNKSISISGDNAVSLELVANVPPYEVFLNQVVPFDTLPKNRVETYQDLADEIGENISGMMTYGFGTLEASQISDNILWSRYSGKIIQSSKEILGLGDKELVTEDDDKVRYQLLVPIINTIQKSSGEELQEISIFFDKLVDSKRKGIDSQNQKDIFHYFNGDITFDDDKKVLSKDETLIGILLSFLEKDYGLDNDINKKATGDFENRVLDVERIKYLNGKTENDNESSQKFNQWYKNLSNGLERCYNKNKEVVAEIEVEAVLRLTEDNLREAYKNGDNYTLLT